VLDKLAHVVRAQQHKAGATATIIMLLMIARLTLYPAPGPLPSGFQRCLLCGTYGLADFIDNVILFVPLGFALRLAGVRRLPAWLFTLALAAGIETAQDYVISGRESSLSDLISNPLGGAIGIALADARGLIFAPSAAIARRLAATWALALAAIAVLLAWGFQLSIPRTGAYWTQVASRLPQYVPFDGTILDATIDGQPVIDGRVDSTAGAAMRVALQTGSARIEARIVPAARTDRITPLVTVYDQWRNEIFILGCRRGRIVFRSRTHSENVSLHPMSFQERDGCPMGDTTTVVAEPLDHGARVRLTIERHGTQRIATQGAGFWLGWHLLVPNDGWWSDLETPFTVLWMVALFIPFAYWRARADREAGVAHRASAAFVGLIGLTLLATLVVIPLIGGSTAAPLVAWIGGVGGAALGWIGAQWTVPHSEVV
jgi:VanZ like family